MDNPYSTYNRAQDEFSSINVMEVSGEGEVSAKPDKTTLVVGVVTENQDVKAATSVNAMRSQQVLDSLLRLGIPSDQIETIVYTIQPLYDYKEGESILKGFRVEHLYRVTLSDIQSAGLIYDTAINNGANIARGLTFEVSNPSPFYLNALGKAYVDGYQKAAYLAQQMRVRLNLVPFKIIEIPQNDNVIMYKSQMLQAATTPIQPQKVVVSAKLKIWFTYYC